MDPPNFRRFLQATPSEDFVPFKRNPTVLLERVRTNTPLLGFLCPPRPPHYLLKSPRKGLFKANFSEIHHFFGRGCLKPFSVEGVA